MLFKCDKNTQTSIFLRCSNKNNSIKLTENLVFFQGYLILKLFNINTFYEFSNKYINDIRELDYFYDNKMNILKTIGIKIENTLKIQIKH